MAPRRREYRDINSRPVQRRAGYDDMQVRYHSRGNGTHRRRKSRQRMMMRMLPVIIIMAGLLIAAIIFATSGALDDLSYSNKTEDMSEWFGEVKNEEAVVVKDGEYTEERVTLLDGVPYINYDTVKSEYTKRFFKDEANNSLLYTNATETIRTVIGTNTYGPTGTEYKLDSEAVKLRGETMYISMEFLGLFKTIDYDLFGGTDGTPYRIEIRTSSQTFETAKLKDDKAIRVSDSKKANVLVKPGKGATLRVLSETASEENGISSLSEGWKRVMTEDLITGYIEEKFLTSFSQETKSVNEKMEVSVPQQSLGEPVVLGWSMIAGQSGNDVIAGQINSAKGMNVLCPTWFYLADNEGNVASLASNDVVSNAHSKGIQVWGMVDNFTNLDITTAYILGDTNRRKFVIDQLISYANQYDLDGLNIDFESLPEEAGEPFIQFIRELSIETRANNLILSVDNYVPTVSTKIYNRKEQGIFVDYVIIMGYDEHTKGSTEAGSVASIGFVTEGIDKTLEEVPKEKVVNAIPFYTRMWKTEDKTDEELSVADVNADGEILSYNITEVQNLPMKQALDTVKEHGATPVWDETTKQNYAEWSNANGKTMIWLEDADSINAKLQVMKDRDVAGIAVWALGYSEDFAWDVINQYY